MDVTLGLPCNAIPLTSLKQDEAILCAVDHIFTEPFDEDAGELIFTDDEWLGLLSVLEEVVEFLIINLEEGAIDSEAQARLIAADLMQLLEDFIDCLGDDTKLARVLKEILSIAHVSHGVLVTEVVLPMRTKHSVCFTRSSLSIRKDR